MKSDIMALLVFFMMGFNLCIPVIQKQFEIDSVSVKADPLGDGLSNDWNWTIENDAVYINNSWAYLSATPHTLVDDGWVEFELESKQLSGSIDVGFGFNNTTAQPRRIEIWRNYTHNMTGRRWVEQYLNSTFWVTDGVNLGIENYDNYTVNIGNKNNTKLWNLSYTYYDETGEQYNYSIIIAFMSQISVDANYTFFYYDDVWETYYYDSTFWDWKPFNFDYTVIDYSFRDANKWYLFRDISIQEDVRYKIRGWIDIPFGGLEGSCGKYWWVMKPHGKTIAQSIADGHFLYLDPWWETPNWTYRKLITIDHTKVDATLTNFPILFDNTSSDFLHAQDDGDDFAFVAEDNTTQYHHEMESYNASGSNRLIAWVNITTLSADIDTNLWLYYGNATCNSQEEVADTWDSDYIAVWHWNSSFLDSTANDYDGTNENLVNTTGIVAGGLQNSRMEDRSVIVSNFYDSSADDTLTAEMWIKFVDNDEDFPRIFSKATDYNNMDWGSYFRKTDGQEHRIPINDTFSIQGGTLPGNYGVGCFGFWFYSWFTINGTDQYAKAYANKTKLFQQTGIVEMNITNDHTTLYIANDQDGESWNGTFDETRVSKIVRSWEWMNTTYNTIISPSTFLSVGSEQSADTTPPTITINFAGNLGDSGGPYWQPPGESTQLIGDWSDGYYTNDSRQSEGWMYINLTVSDGGGVPNVWLQWKNESTWTNYTYAFLNTTGGYFEFNTSGNISTAEGYNYSFNIVANDTTGNSKNVWWNKTGNYDGDVYTRRYVQLNCSRVNISYTPLYFYQANYSIAHTFHEDRLHHDQGFVDADDDTGYLLNIVPDDFVHLRGCAIFVDFYFDNDTCIMPFTLNNIYSHIWWSSSSNDLDRAGWDRTRTWHLLASTEDDFSTDSSNNKSAIYYDNGLVYSNDYFLDAHLLNTVGSDRAFTDNDIFEFYFEIAESAGGINPSLVSNRSFTSFILFNIPDNATLNASYADTDSDGLSDWTELYVNYTNPFLADTDNDGVSDYDETLSGSDPNNYTDTIEYKEWVTLDRWNITLSNTSFFFITDVKATPSEAVINNISINITCNVTSLYAIVNVTVNMTDGSYDMTNIGDLYYYIAINSTIGTHYYHIYANDTSGDQLESATYSFKIIGLSCSFTYTVNGGLMTLTPTITGATHYQWTFINETGVTGATSWIPIEDIGSYIQGYVYPTIITVILSAKNINFDQYANYSDVIRIYKSSFDKTKPTEEEPPPEPSNVFKDTADAVGKWFGERNGGELLFMAVMVVIALLFVIKKKYPSKKFIYQILKKKKKKEKEMTPHERLIERIDRLEENVFPKNK